MEEKEEEKQCYGTAKGELGQGNQGFWSPQNSLGKLGKATQLFQVSIFPSVKWSNHLT